jgi:hypothetical protein
MSIVKNKYSQRLFEEWKIHGKIIISTDFDDTIFAYRENFNEEDIQRTIKLLQLAHYTGAYIVVFTACNTDRFSEIQEYCEKVKIPIDAINNNPIALPYGNNGKIYYNINLCDRSGLNEALDILESALYQYRGFKESNKQLDEIG